LITLHFSEGSEQQFPIIEGFLDLAFNLNMELRVEVILANEAFVQYCEVRGVKILYK
jgi:hypothetical protein